MICPMPALELWIAMVRGIVSKLGVLQIVQFVMDGDAGKAPTAAMHRQPYLDAYEVVGSKPAVSHPRPPMIDIAVMCQPRALKRSAVYETARATTNATTHYKLAY